MHATFVDRSALVFDQGLHLRASARAPTVGAAAMRVVEGLGSLGLALTYTFSSHFVSPLFHPETTGLICSDLSLI